MSELRSIVEALRGEVLADLPDARIEEDFAELQRAVQLLDAERLRRLAEIDRRRLFERDGHLSSAAWLASTSHCSAGGARQDVRVARGLEHMPVTGRALAAGEIPMAAVRILVRAREADPTAFEASEAQLVEAARIHSAHDLFRVVAYWRDAVDRRAMSEGDDRARARRRLHASVSFLGMVRVDGDLDPETGETLLTALGAVMDAESHTGGDDDRTPSQRRADALGEICRQWLDRTDRPIVAGERPHVTVTVDAEALSGSSLEGTDDRVADRSNGLAEHPSAIVSNAPRTELDHVGSVPTAVARRLSCDSSVMRVVMSARSEPLDVGRRTPIVPPAMRRAVVVRDRHCGFPGCDRPHSWCDAHHVVHWVDGGSTAMGNLILLCRRHHRAVHERGGFRLSLEEGSPVFRRRDGSPLAAVAAGDALAPEDRAPP